MKRPAEELLEPAIVAPYEIGPGIVPVTEEMRRLIATRFDVHALVAQKPGIQKKVDLKFAKRFMKELKEIDFTFQVLRASIMATTRGGRRQFTHCDVSPELARNKQVGVYIQNLGNDAFVLYVRVHGVDLPVSVPPGMAIRFPADTPHAGSGEVHAHRLYVLYAEKPLIEEDVRAILLDSELLFAVL